MAEVIIYTKGLCPYCEHAKQLLIQKKVPYREIRVDQDAKALETMIYASKQRTLPQIFINQKPIGGFDQLRALEQAGQLDQLLVK